jgi:hypothetical protein
MSSRLPLLPDQFTPGYPPKAGSTALTVQYFVLSDILTRAWTTDAHTTAYSVEAWPYRLSKAAIDLDSGVLMVLFIADVDCEQSHAASGGQEDLPAPDHWWLQELDKVDQLQRAYPRAFIYQTQGGYRVVYVLPKPRCLHSPADVDAWKADYLAWVAALRLRFLGIVARPRRGPPGKGPPCGGPPCGDSFRRGAPERDPAVFLDVRDATDSTPLPLAVTMRVGPRSPSLTSPPPGHRQ